MSLAFGVSVPRILVADDIGNEKGPPTEAAPEFCSRPEQLRSQLKPVACFDHIVFAGFLVAGFLAAQAPATHFPVE